MAGKVQKDKWHLRGELELMEPWGLRWKKDVLERNKSIREEQRQNTMCLRKTKELNSAKKRHKWKRIMGEGGVGVARKRDRNHKKIVQGEQKKFTEASFMIIIYETWRQQSCQNKYAPSD